MGNNQLKLVVAAILLIAAIIIGMKTLGGSSVADRPDSEYFFNLATAQIELVPLNTLPPVNDGQSVRAYVYTCSACEPDEWTIVYLERLTEEAKPLAEQLETGQVADEDIVPTARTVEAATYVAAYTPQLDELQWTPTTTNDGQQITSAPRQLCNSGTSVRCYPGK